MGPKVLAAIVNEIQKAKYFSISVDSAPDVTHIDQLTFMLRYVKNAVPK
jgi:HKD family nuclease